MKWFQGEISVAIQKAITEKKLFVVFVQGENEESIKMEEQLNNDEISGICTDENSVVINIKAESVPGQQFASIYPILCVPSTYLINNDGIPSDIIPSMISDEELTKRLSDGLQKFQSSLSPQVQIPSSSSVGQSSSSGPLSMGETIAQDASVPVDQVTSPKEDTKERAEQLLEKARIQKAKKEKEEQKERERKRREEGRELSQAKRDIAERQTKQLADEIAKRRAEDKAARERVKEQIRQDREDKLKKYEVEKKSREQEKENKMKEKAQQSATKSKVDSNTSRLQFRLPDGSTSTKQFPADAKFLVVSEYVTKELVTDYPSLRLTTSFPPKHEFTSEDDLKSLRELDLTPSASIIVSPGKNPSSSSSSLSLSNIIMLVLTPIFALFKWIVSLFTRSGVPSASQPTPSAPEQPGVANTEDNTRSAANVRQRNLGSNTKSGSNIRRLYDDKPDDDENATWNGNSTQQM